MRWALEGVCKVEDSHRAFIHVSAKVQFSSAEDGMVSTRSEKSTYAPPRLSEVAF